MNRLAHDWALIASAAARILERKRAHNPKFIAAGKLGENEARIDEEIWESIAADWRFAATLEGAPASEISQFAKRAALEIAVERAMIRKAGRREDETIGAEIAVLETMLASERKTLGHVWCARTSIALRLAAAAFHCATGKQLA